MEYIYQYCTDSMTSEITNVCIRRLPDGAVIPNDPENTDWQAYQLWIEQGNQPLPPA